MVVYCSYDGFEFCGVFVMIVYYWIDNLGRSKGTINEKKANDMAKSKKVDECDISEFNGHLLGSDWNG